MANSFALSSDVTKEFFRLYKNNLVFPKLVNRQFDDYYGKPGHKISGLQVKKPVKFTTRNNTATRSNQDILQDTVTLASLVQDGVDFSLTRREMLLSADELSAYLAPAARTLASRVDAVCGQTLAQGAQYWTGTAGTPPSTLAVLGDAMSYINEQACPDASQINAVLSPYSSSRLAAGLSTLYQPAGKIGDTIIKGAVSGNVMGINAIVPSQSTYTFRTGAGPGGTPVLSATPSNGATTVAISGGSGSVTAAYRKGDVVTFAGSYDVNPITKAQLPWLKRFVVTADTNSSTGAIASLPIDPPIYDSTNARQNVSAIPSSGAAVTVLSGTGSNYYRQNLVFHPDALVFVTAELPQMNGVHMSKTMTEDGYSLSFTAAYDIDSDTLKCRTDIIYGVTMGMSEWACRITE